MIKSNIACLVSSNNKNINFYYIKGGGHSCNTLRQIRERLGDLLSSSYRLNGKYDCGGIRFEDCISMYERF